MTGNPFKIETARRAFADFSLEIEPVSLDLPEIQGYSSLEVARHSAQQAAEQLQTPVMREDHAFHIPSLGGIPGPYMAYFERNLPLENLVHMLEQVEDRSAYFELGLVYVDPHQEIVHEFTHQVPFQLTTQPAGNLPEQALGDDGHDFSGWSPIMQLVGEEGTLAESPPDNRYPYFMNNFIALAQKLTETGE
ncbi:hypothetical protein LRY60_05345 [Candidatus Woesebacteria bacterium]|nr:hypothetical protein [Candidatus Woesebacteria bacterium]